MSKSFKIKIANPCHEDWQNMSPNAKGRHCQSCEKTVVDFSIMTDADIISFFKNKPQNACGRFTAYQLEKTYPFVTYSQSMSYTRVAALLAGLLVASVGCEKVSNQNGKDNFIQVDTKDKFPENLKIIKGTVEDDGSNSLMGVEITMDGSLQKTYSDIKGRFELIANKDLTNLTIHFNYGENDYKREDLDLKTYNFEQELKVVMFLDFSKVVPLKRCTDSNDYTRIIMGDFDYSNSIDSVDMEKISKYIVKQKYK